MNEWRNKRRGTSWKRMMAMLVVAVLFVGVLQVPILTQAATKITCKTLCKAALKATGGSKKLEFQSTEKTDFPGFTISDTEMVSSLFYLCDEKEVYCICVAKATSKSNAAELLKSLNTYKEQNSESDYLDDYSSTEQKVLKNAICGQKGKYVWYIAMSTKASVNKKGQKKIKGQL